MNPAWVVRTARLVLKPVAWSDLADLQALKGNPSVFAIMLGGVRSPVQVADELAADIAFWGAHGVGMWAIREAGETFRGLVGIMQRPDGRGMSLRFALSSGAQGRGIGREAAGAALRYAHHRAGLPRIVAVAREENIASRIVLGGIGMRECDSFSRDGYRMIVYESP
jgi:RimJ/RimL family protein N-acetyltransferase